ncbi:MAG: peptidylprolyl isomerase [Planctomycetota bacterium]|jgi:cyclophilin family peptidyl-prolyl cis-trans isomerase|nr:peptidylprolyl isomerase [Planctomycetota bacterium]MDP6940740.1 peptidylprolyl isomerase [Planctomycetota bacterium]
MNKNIIFLSLLLSACTNGADDSSNTSRRRSSEQPGVLREASAEEGAAAFAASKAAAKATSEQAAAKQATEQIATPPASLIPAEPWVPKREPQFHFEPEGAVSDADLGNYWVEMSCSVDGKDVGKMTFEFWPEKAPITVRNFLRYCDEGFYDGTGFHRVLRDFMIQGGDPTGTGGGDGPYGNIKGEFSEEKPWEHHYGVLSMARSQSEDSASCQFFVICAESGSVWNLDGKYASFGMMTSGVNTLEGLASTKTIPDGRENSKPLSKLVIESAVVHEGEAPRGEIIERPQPDFGDEPASVVVQHCLVSFKDANPAIKAERSKEEAIALANEVAERARKGEDFSALVREFSADPVRPGDTQPGVYALLNTGAFDTAFERANYEASKKWQKANEDFRSRQAKGEIDQKEMMDAMQKLREELMASMPPRSAPREQMVAGFSRTAFSLKVGEVGICEFHPQDSKFGYHVMKRLK